MTSVTNFNVPVKEWTHLMEQVSAHGCGKHIYQVYTPSGNQVSVSYEVLTPSEFTDKCQRIFNTAIENMHSDLLALSKNRTRKLSLYETLSYTNALLKHTPFNDGNARDKASELFNTLKLEEEIKVEEILDKSLDVYGKLATTLSDFHTNRIVYHRKSYSGYAREFISLIGNIFKGCFKGNQTLCNEALDFVKTGRRILASSVYQILATPLDPPPPYTPRKNDSSPPPPLTPVASMLADGTVTKQGGDKLRQIRDALANYIKN